MPGLATVTVIGHAGRDAEARFSAAGKAFTTFSVGVSNGTQAEPHTDWYRVTCFGRLAEIMGERVQKGVLVCVQGRLQQREWTGKDGTTKHDLDVVASEVVVLERRERVAADAQAWDGIPSTGGVSDLDTIPW